MRHAFHQALHCQVLVNEPLDSSYKDFLVFCKELRDAQLGHTVSVVAVAPPPLADDSADKTPRQPLTFYDVKLSEVIAAKAAGLGVTNAPVSTAKNPANSEPANTNSAGMAYDVKPTINRIDKLALTKDLPASQPTSEYIQDVFADPNAVQFQMRTFEAAMYSTAKEGVYFKLISEGKKTVSYTGVGTLSFSNDSKHNIVVATVTDGDGGCSFTANPILTLERRPNLSELVRVNHDNQTYVIGDPKDQAPDDPKKSLSPSNRTVFTLLSYLFTQVSIDPQKLPAQPLIQTQQ